MGKVLSQQQISEYKARGILFPIAAVGEADARRLLQHLEGLERSEGGKISRRTNHKPHLLLRWLNELIRDPRVLDPVEDLIGPDIFCWATDFFIKNPNDKGRVTWHQDFDLLGTVQPGCRDCLGCLHGEHCGKRLHARRSRDPSEGPASAP